MVKKELSVVFFVPDHNFWLGGGSVFRGWSYLVGWQDRGSRMRESWFLLCRNCVDICRGVFHNVVSVMRGTYWRCPCL